MKNLILTLGLFLFPLTSLSQEPVENIRVPEWVEFQSTQEKLVEQQTKLLGDLTEIRQKITQININLLSWQDTVQNAAAGKEVHCDAWKNKYDPRIEYGVIAFALFGCYSLLNNFFGLFKKNEKPNTGV